VHELREEQAFLDEAHARLNRLAAQDLEGAHESDAHVGAHCLRRDAQELRGREQTWHQHPVAPVEADDLLSAAGQRGR